MKIGYPGLLFDIPAPSSGMGFANNSDTETLELDTGGRFISDKATTFKSFNMSWRSSSPKLQPLIDIYNKRYGTEPFYIQDMRGGEGNILPARWAYPQQLASIHGASGNASYFGTFAQFTTNRFSGNAPTLKVPTFSGKDLKLAVFRRVGDLSTIPIVYRLHNSQTGSWTTWRDCPYVNPAVGGAAPKVVCTAVESQTYDFIELKVNLGANRNIVIEHMDLSTSDYRSYDNPWRSAEGVGALKFTNTLEGDLVMLRSKRIGLSVDLTEVQVG